MEKGQVRQIGTQRELYEKPADRFVAGFIGRSAFIEGQVTGPVSYTHLDVYKRQVGAQILRMEGKLGTVQTGAFADLILVDGDPLKDLALFQEQGKHLAAIMKGGAFHKNTLH